MWYIVDGYNLLFRKVPEKGNLQHHRELLIAHLVEMSLSYHITVVFDAPYSDSDRVRLHVRDLEVIYTDEGVDADKEICEMIAQTENPAVCTVVTSDNKLAWLTRQLGAKTLSVESFTSLPLTKKRRRTPPVVSTTRKSHLRKESPEFLRWLEIFETRLQEEGHLNEELDL